MTLHFFLMVPEIQNDENHFDATTGFIELVGEFFF